MCCGGKKDAENGGAREVKMTGKDKTDVSN